MAQKRKGARPAPGNRKKSLTGHRLPRERISGRRGKKGVSIMKKTLSLLLVLCLLAAVALTSCSTQTDPPADGTTVPGTSQGGSGTTGDLVDSGKTDIPDDLTDNVNTLVITCTEGTDACWSFDAQTLTFSGLSADTVCSVSGEFDGKIVIDAGDDFQFEIEFCGVKLYSSRENPITVLSGDKVTLSAKKGTENKIYDMRDAISEGDETSYSAAVYAVCDLNLGGKGDLTVISSHNNGIHTKGDLKIKNLTLSVTCEDNALKGNDSVSISGGILALIAKSGDGIKTTSTDVSQKGNQRGTVAITGGTVNIYAACDGIDAAYDADISDEAVLNIYTERYSPYSETTGTAESKTAGTAMDTASSGGSAFGGGPGGMGGGPGGMGGNPGGMTDGNHEKSDVSTKGIKAGNAIHISGGTVTVNAYDDAIHANGGETLENGSTSTGDIRLSDGTLTLFSEDDGVHADGTLTVSGGTVRITGCYEGLEGAYVAVQGGDISIVSSDDGINATATNGTGVTFTGGNVYIYAGGDGVDANSRTSYEGILFSGGVIVIVSTSGGDSSIDTEQGYTYTGGTVLALCPANGMGNEAVNCRNFSSVGTKTTMNLSEGATLSAKVGGAVTASVTMPCRLSALVVYLGASNADFVTE